MIVIISIVVSFINLMPVRTGTKHKHQLDLNQTKDSFPFWTNLILQLCVSIDISKIQ